LLEEGEGALAAKITALLQDCRKLLLLTGSASLEELRAKPLVVTGFARQWLEARGFDVLSWGCNR
jgi:isopentenyl-diphosphate delta-isomerase